MPDSDKPAESAAPAAPQSVEGSAAAQYGMLIRSQMDQESAFRTTLEQRATNVVTSSGTLVSLLFAFTAFARGSSGLSLPAGSKVSLLLALAFFVIAVIVGLAYVALYGRPGLARSHERLQALLTPENWRSPDALTASLRVATVQFDLLTFTAGLNRDRQRFVGVAVGMEALAVLFLGLSILGILFAH